MTRPGWVLLILRPDDTMLTHCGRRGSLKRDWAAKPNVSWMNKFLIFCSYEAQSLDLFLNFVRISETNLSQIGRFRFAPVELFVARRQRFRGRSVANWQ
jgi:hypothetical protein